MTSPIMILAGYATKLISFKSQKMSRRIFGAASSPQSPRNPLQICDFVNDCDILETFKKLIQGQLEFIFLKVSVKHLG